MLRTRGSRGADKMDVLALVRAEECQPVASDDSMNLLGRTAKNELALILGCAGVGYTQHAGKPEQPCENLSFHLALHLVPPSHAPRRKINLPVDRIASAQSLPLPRGWGLFRRCRALPCLWPYGPAERDPIPEEGVVTVLMRFDQ